MNTNIGKTDRALRLVAGIAIITLGIYFKSWWGVVGLIPLITGTVKVCPLYLPFKFSSKKP